MTTYIGIDLGGTKIAAAAVDIETGLRSGATVVPTEAQEGPDAVLRRMAGVADMVREKAGLDRDAVAGLGIGVPGVTDLEGGNTLFLPNLPTAWRGVPVVAKMQEHTGYPTAMINDARAFILGEATWGAGRNTRTVVGLTLGTGIGGGITIDGKLHLGLDGTAGEVGHLTINPDGPICGCGNYGCLEAFASGPAITAMGAKAVLQGRTTAIGSLVGHDLNKITPQTIMHAAEGGDDVAREILHSAGSYLGIGISLLITLLSPDRVIIGGGVARLGTWLLEPIQQVVQRRCLVTPLDRVQIVLAALGVDAGIIGAAVWASQRTIASPGATQQHTSQA